MTSFQLRIATRMGTTLSLIFRRLATKFSNLVQKKNPPGPAGPAKAGPLFSGSLDSFSDCRDSLRTRRLGQVSYASPPLPCLYSLVPRPLPDCISQPWRFFPRLRDKIWEWPGDEVTACMRFSYIIVHALLSADLEPGAGCISTNSI